MAETIIEDIAERDVIVKLEGQKLLRRFTDELEGQTTLERATKKLQQQQDDLEKDRYTAQVRAFFEDEYNNNAVFHVAETARLALEKTCRKFEAPSPPSMMSKIANRKSARMSVNEVMRRKASHGFFELNEYIKGLETEWKSNQGKFAQRFRSICGNLDAHSNAFAMFPSQNNYASALCGGLSFIVSAAVNHDEIADTISETVTQITQKAARAAKALFLVPTKAMRELFSELYAQVFEFYSDAIEWYMQSKFSRLFKSFNEKIKDRYDRAAIKIEATLTEIFRELDVAKFALAKIQLSAQERTDDMLRQRQQTFDAFTIGCAGRNAQHLLLGWHKSICIEKSVDGSMQQEDKHGLPREIETSSNDTELLDRPAARNVASSIKTHVVGREGQDLFGDGKYWLPEVDVSTRLHEFIGQNSRSATLWVSGPFAGRQEMPNSRVAAMHLFLAAWQAEMPLISHFCERPRASTLPKHGMVEEAGLIGLLYSLIYQLLQFEFGDDPFRIPRTELEKLDGSDQSWEQAIDIFSKLLEATPHLSLCVIDGLNELAYSTSSANWCATLLQVIHKHQAQSLGTFKLLLSTQGNSRVLQDHISVSDRLTVQGRVREVMQNVRGREYR